VMALGHVQIGEVAERTGLSLRTIRYYEEVGLVTPSSRTTGGFRLYSELDVSRLQLVKRMKPLDFSLEDMRELLGVLDDLEDGDLTPQQRVDLLGRLDMYRQAADLRVRALREQLAVAEGFAGDLRREIGRQKKMVKARP
jgi:DNA-binding transcriptional MerR regulator